MHIAVLPLYFVTDQLLHVDQPVKYEELAHSLTQTFFGEQTSEIRACTDCEVCAVLFTKWSVCSTVL